MLAHCQSLLDSHQRASQTESLPFFSSSDKAKANGWSAGKGWGVFVAALLLALVFYLRQPPSTSDLEGYFSDWLSAETGGFRKHHVGAPVWALWEQLISDPEYTVRKRLLLHSFEQLKPKRVLEFGGRTGGTLAQAAFDDPKVNGTLHHWVHATSSAISLEYANMLFRNEDLMANPKIDLDEALSKLPEGWAAESPLNSMSPPARPTRALQAVDLDISDLRSWIGFLDLSKFDLLVAPSMEDFRNTMAILLGMPRSTRIVFCVTGGNGPGPFSDEATLRDYLKFFLRIEHVMQAVHAGHSTFLVQGLIGSS
mmetsp:Transcript_30127/g.65104  ORF Transcript_30127/g.65104 Transcript_30127/m.65104 type:complete len:311 (-) Transcript_30127:203-1135(-)|eukprot:CAMPEP_0206423340 /NCGR_PEP_ID=MMETSP0324_2-20121206/2628_1 /ASSEMBLY_ACC=CAM_ASM_000836 /TAXON_ID=2866 /ORGANISM="Crypthecodinium cohnii, Strain Seligo" /LENGTH=310 /DNA_ID=CAMNT_0053887893 /DNA_START=227 /DNA_END=1159 /DNA_ORIENTATION=-